MSNCEYVTMLSFAEKGDINGKLVIAEGDDIDVPFNIKRVFYIYGSNKNVIRGKHANLYSKFVLINVAGTSKVKVIDENCKERIYILNKPNMGIYLPNMVWKEMYDFSDNSVLLCLSSEHYNSNEYIRDFEVYSNLVKNEGKK